MTTFSQPITIAVPGLHSYNVHTGIGRVFRSLCDKWGEHVHLVNATFDTVNIPVLRNFPFGVHVSGQADFVLLGQITGAQALRNTSGLPSLAIVHDIGIVDFPGDREGINWLTQLSVLRSFYGLRKAHAVIVDSDFTHRRLLHFLPELAGRVITIHAGVNEQFLAYNQVQSIAKRNVERLVQKPLGSPLILYVGSELPRKNIDLLLRVFDQIRRRYPSAQLLKVGKPGHSRWRERTLNIAQTLGLEIDKDMLILENVDDQALCDCYCAAHVFLSTSLYEGFGLPALEAMAIGAPVIVTNQGSFPEVVGDAGWTVEPTVDAFVAAIQIALEADHTVIAKRGRFRAAQFNWNIAAAKYLDTLSQLKSSVPPKKSYPDM